MPTLTCYPIGNADCSLIELANGRTLVFDYADVRNPDDKTDRRIDLEAALREKLKANNRDYVDVLAFSHIDRDHIKGAHVLFHFEHAEKYQEPGSILIKEMWVPAAAIVEPGVDEDARIIRTEARYRLKAGSGIRIFSRPEVLKDWLEENGLTIEDRRHLFVDAGQFVPTFTRESDGLEVFAHSPFASRLDGGAPIDRNTDSILVHLTFVVKNVETKVILGADADYQMLSDIVDITRYHEREVRLEWDVFHLPHHCSYLSLGPEKGADKTDPVENVKWLFESQGRKGGIVISPSDPIPLTGDSVQPPHRQAANYYRGIAKALDGKFIVTMEHPSSADPKPMVIEIGHTRARVTGLTVASVTGVISSVAPRAGKGG